jgi:nicotinate-nucleotide adenylyltransferase
MSAHRRLGVLGGTFDPVHFGHLDAGDAAQSALALDEVRLIPAHDPPHRPVDPRASAYHRFALVSLAIAERPSWRVSDVELARPGASYSIDTLRALHADGWTASQIFFILGADAFAEIATWRQFPDVLDASHFVVVARPGMTLDEAVARTPQLRARMRQPGDAGTASSETGVFLIAARTRNVSSTEIRTRLAAGLPIDDLVPTLVARHILAHQLYGAVDDLHGEKQRTHR